MVIKNNTVLEVTMYPQTQGATELLTAIYEEMMHQKNTRLAAFF